MKRKLLASILALALFLGVAAPQTALWAAPSGGYAAYQVTPVATTSTGASVQLPSMMELRVRAEGTAGDGLLAYGLNARRSAPDTLTQSAAGTKGYKAVGTTAVTDVAPYVDKARQAASVTEDVESVVWNGYPYYAGSWKGVTKDYKNLGNSGAPWSRLQVLYGIHVTQQAIWYFTDSQAAAASDQPYVAALLEAAEKNPAPANFSLSLYDGTAASGAAAQKYENLVALHMDVNAAAKKQVAVTLTNKWLEADGMTIYTGAKPQVTAALYEGTPSAGQSPIQTWTLDGAAESLSFKLLDDNKTYTLRQTISDGDFSVSEDQVIDLAKTSGDALALQATITHKSGGGILQPDAIKVDLGAEVTLDGKNPSDGVFTLLLKDANGQIVQTKTNSGKQVRFEPLAFDKAGVYTYTISELAGDNKDIQYDTSAYNVRVKVEGTETLTAAVSYEKNGVAYTGVPAFASKSKETAAKTTSVTVNKVWKNDKTSSRPSSVTVQLYRDGKAYGDSVKLNKDNGWQHVWKDLDASYKWTVNETAVPTNYTKTLANKDNVWTITNTAKSGTAAAANNTKTPTVKSSTKDRNTPETGDTSHMNGWITVAVFSLSGMVLIALLWAMDHRRRLRSKK